ncbi:MAG: DNA-binding protein [Verrucomicrobiaceae bacterium]|nr:MAG: DNA-binding protein [Verrucomicrobiaceae bacterium]
MQDGQHALAMETTPSPMPLRNQSPEQIAEAFGVLAEHIRKLARTGEIPATKIGGLWRFNLTEVQAALDKRTRKLTGAE